MLWLLILLTSHSSLAAADNVAKASALAKATAATKPPRDSTGPGATMTRWFEALRSAGLGSRAGGACPVGTSCCDGAWTSYGAPYTCAYLTSTYNWDCSGCNCPGDPSPPPSLPSLPSPPSPPPATARSVALGEGYCRDASGINSWSYAGVCLDTVQECGQACETTTDCACFAHTSPDANPDTSDGCMSAGRD
eukprot:scaffold85216_cov60-Phaeocystis_antarctica.AAC.1